MVTTRPMADEDIDEAAAMFIAAIAGVYAQYQLPGQGPPEADATRRARLAHRIAHMLGTDPGGAWVAVDAGRLVGVSQAVVRQGLWILSLLGVAATHQDRGVGRALIDRAIGYGDRTGPALIYSSRDPRAMRRYVRSGFSLLPSVEAIGSVHRGSLPAVPEVRPGDRGDLGLVERVDRHLRGAAHGPDLEYYLGSGGRLLVAEDRGYALVGDGHLVLVGAFDDDAARLLLRAALAELSAPAPVPGTGANPGGADEVELSVDWLTGDQQWAFEVCADVGLALHPMGAIMVRGRPGPLSPYVPSGGFG